MTKCLSFSGALLCVMLAVLPAAGAENADAVLRCDAPGRVFKAGDAIIFTRAAASQSPTAAGAEDTAYTITSYDGKTLWKGALGNDASHLTIPVLPPGAYTLKAGDDGEKIEFLVLPPPTRQPENGFFAVDSAQSWLATAERANPAAPQYPGDSFALISDLAAMAGVAAVRDRLSWRESEQSDHTFQFGRYDRNATLLHERGVAVNGMFHDAPAATLDATTPPSEPQTPTPDDLRALYRFTRELGRAFHGRMLTWEFWNEPDHNAHTETAWSFAAATKAAYLGFKAGDPTLPVLSASFTEYPLGSYFATFMKSGGADYFDIFNFHIYYPLTEFPGIVRNLRESLGNFHAAHKPIWITENGCCEEEYLPNQPSGTPGIRVHSPEQERVMAEFVPKSQILLQNLGVNRSFFFILGAYHEQGGRKDWGLLRLDNSAKPAFGTLAGMIHALGNAVPAGEFSPAPGVKGYYYFQNDGTQTLAFWVPDRVDDRSLPENPAPIRFPMLPVEPGSTLQLTDAFGAPQQLEAGFLTARKEVQYLRGKLNWKPEPRQPLHTTGAFGGGTREELATAAGKGGTSVPVVVIKPLLLEGFDVVSPLCAALEKAGKMRIELYNFSNQPQHGSLQVAGGTVTGVPEAIELPPQGKYSIEAAFHTVPNSGGREIVISGNFNGREIAPAVVPILTPDRETELNWRDPNRWRPNAAGSMTIAFDPAEEALRVETVFNPDVDRWAYPEFPLLLPQESLKDAIGVSYEIKAAPENAAGEFRCAAFMSVMGTENELGDTRLQYVKPPTDKWEKRVVFFPPGLERDKIQMFRIGMNPVPEKPLTFFLRNVRAVQP